MGRGSKEQLGIKVAGDDEGDGWEPQEMDKQMGWECHSLLKPRCYSKTGSFRS